MKRLCRLVTLGAFAAAAAGCALTGTDPKPGPDRQAEGTLTGALTGAGTGAVTGFQIGAGAGPGALVGAGVGAVAGAVRGIVQDHDDDRFLALEAEARREKERAYAQKLLQEHYKRRIELHPTRDIFPADLFFFGDQAKLRPEALPVVKELARMNKERLPWSRLVVTAYVKAADPDSEFAQYLAQRRTREIVDHFVQAGLEPRRLEGRAVLIKEPVLIDPYDKPDRYNQAIELIPVDR